MKPCARILVLGADGFIGRHIAFRLRTRGYVVRASARRTSRLAQMGFETVKLDLTDPSAARPEGWHGALEGVDAVINAAGLLTGPRAAFRAVHVDAPKALYEAADTRPILLLSAIGIDTADTDFARFRRDGEDIARAANAHILRAGLVLGDTSYGGSSMVRALAAFPLVTPIIGAGDQPFNPLHASDLADAMIDALSAPAPVRCDIGGPETLTLAALIKSYRGWLGLAPARPLRLPLGLARLTGTLGDLMRLGPISRTAVDQLSAGVFAGPHDPQLTAPRGFARFLGARPAGTQDLWHARLYLMRPALRLVLAALWLISGLLGLMLPSEAFLPLINTALPDTVLIALARIGGLIDLALAAALLRGVRPRLTAALQGAMVLGYTAAFTLLAPALWLLPLGGLLKNLPILALILISFILEDER